MNADDSLRGSCSCGRYNYIIRIPAEDSARSQAYVHFGAGDLDRRSHSSILSAWLKVPLTWYQSITVSQFPDERSDHIARTFISQQLSRSQRKFCGFCGTHMSYWTEEPASEQDYLNVTLGSLRQRDLLALEDLDLLPEDVDLSQAAESTDEFTTSQHPVVPTPSDNGLAPSTRSGPTGGISWFKGMIQGSQLGRHSNRREEYGTPAVGTTTVSWEVAEHYDGGEEEQEETAPAGSKRKAGEIESEDTMMKG